MINEKPKFRGFIENIASSNNINIELIESNINYDISSIENIDVEVSLLNKAIKANINELLKPLKVKLDIILDVSSIVKLNVSPEETQWIALDEEITYTVESNTRWVVLNS